MRALNTSSVVEPDDARRRADTAWQLAGTDMAEARAIAERVIAEAADAGALAVAHRVIGLASVELGDTDACTRHMDAGLVEAHHDGAQDLIAQGEMGVAMARQYAGDRRSALRLAQRARRRAPEHARLALSHGVILERYGDAAGALQAYDDAERLGSHDPATLSRVGLNRGALRIYLADLRSARADLEASLALAEGAGLTHVALGAEANLGFLFGRQGQVIDALARLDGLTDRMVALGGLRHGTHELDRCETLLVAGLARDAMAAGQAAIDAFESVSLVVEAAEARTLAAQAALVAGDLTTAQQQAERARGALRRHRAGVWAVLAEEVVVRAAWQAGGRSAALAARATRVADALDAAGLRAAGAGARVVSARIELALGRQERAAAQLRRVDETVGRSVGLQLQARCASALLRRAADDRRGARAALRSGWQLLERHRATLGATELRVGATAHVAEIVGIGLEMAIEDRRPREVLRWAERGRAGALTPRATAPPADDALAGLLGELRVVAGEADAAAKRGDDTSSLLRRQRTLEQRVRSRARLLPPEERDGLVAPDLDPAELSVALADRALIEFVISEGDLWAVVVVRGRFSLRRICTEATIGDEVEGLRVAMRRLAVGSPIPQLRAAARAAAMHARERLKHLLFAPLADLVAGRPRVVVPMGVLHAVPWAALHEPSETLVVTPSASLWARASTRAAAAAPAAAESAMLLVDGPRLEHAAAEIADIARLVRGATTLTGPAATVDAVRDALAGASLAHLACHGHFRADNPLFSSLELYDGALSVFELERLGRAPQRIVLSACDAGLSAVHPGDELLGLAAALLRLGTTGIIASVLPVPDDATRRLMVALHEQLAAGAGLSDALGAARATLDPERDDDLVASWAFQVLGAG